MPFNKVHDILDDSLSYPYMDKVHLTRAGLMLNTIAQSKPVVLSQEDCRRIIDHPSRQVDMAAARELGPMVLQFDGQRDGDGRFIICILLVPMQERDELRCYPYSNNNTDQKMWPYDKHFVILNPSDLSKMDIQESSTHPLADTEKLDEKASSHMGALSAVALKFLMGLQGGIFTLIPEGRNYDKLNKKRQASKKSPIQPDNLLEWK